MKKLLIAFLFIINFTTAKAQMTLEHTYDSVLYATMVNLSVSGYKYVIINWVDSAPVRIFNLDHSLFKEIYPPKIPGYTCTVVGTVISDHLFNSDDLVECLAFYGGGPAPIFKVINENGQVVDSGLGGYDPLVYHDAGGNYKFLSRGGYSQVYVYSLPGTQPCVSTCGSGPLNVSGASQQQPVFLSAPVPNPSTGETTIEYTLPRGEPFGWLTVYNMNGQQLRSYKVSSLAPSLKINSGDLPRGTYYYHIWASGKISDTKKLIILN